MLLLKHTTTIVNKGYIMKSFAYGDNNHAVIEVHIEEVAGMPSYSTWYDNIITSNKFTVATFFKDGVMVAYQEYGTR